MIAAAADPGWACAQAISLFFQHLDERREDAAAALFVADGVWHRRGEAVAGRPAVLAALLARPPSRVARHLVTNIVVLAQPPGMIARYYVTIFVDEAAGDAMPLLAAPAMMLACEDRLVETATGWLFAMRSSRTIFARK